jgi:hypothetical protein
MTSRTQYVLVETLISVAINTALSIGFVFLVFHGQSQIATTGPHGIVLDMAPQTFMVVLMSCLVPGLLTRARLTSGRLVWCQRTTPPPTIANICLRAILLAFLATCPVVAVSWMILPHLFPTGIDFRTLVLYKALFGMFLAAVVTPWAIAKVLR